MTDDDTLKIVGNCGGESEPVEVELVTDEEREISGAVEKFIADALAG